MYRKDTDSNKVTYTSALSQQNFVAFLYNLMYKYPKVFKCLVSFKEQLKQGDTDNYFEYMK